MDLPIVPKRKELKAEIRIESKAKDSSEDDLSLGLRVNGFKFGQLWAIIGRAFAKATVDKALKNKMSQLKTDGAKAKATDAPKAYAIWNFEVPEIQAETAQVAAQPMKDDSEVHKSVGYPTTLWREQRLRCMGATLSRLESSVLEQRSEQGLKSEILEGADNADREAITEVFESKAMLKLWAKETCSEVERKVRATKMQAGLRSGDGSVLEGFGSSVGALRLLGRNVTNGE